MPVFCLRCFGFFVFFPCFSLHLVCLISQSKQGDHLFHINVIFVITDQPFLWLESVYLSIYLFFLIPTSKFSIWSCEYVSFDVQSCNTSSKPLTLVQERPLQGGCSAGGRIVACQLEGRGLIPHIKVSLGKTLNPTLDCRCVKRCMND